MNLLQRYQQRRAIGRRIQQLDPQRDHLEIVFLVGAYHFPFATQRVLEFALFRTFAVPGISGLLDKTGTFAHHGQKRYDDTALLLAEIAEHGYDSPRGASAIRRMNYLHGRYDIPNADFLYVLSSFIYELKRLNPLVGWRRSTYHEELANYYFWVAVGERMGIRDIPPTYEAFADFKAQYERDHFRYADSNRRVAEHAMRTFLAWFPRWSRSLVRRGILAMMDKPLADALGYPPVSRVEQGLFRVGMWFFRLGVWLLPPRATPFLLTQHRNRSYPQGYDIDHLGS